MSTRRRVPTAGQEARLQAQQADAHQRAVRSIEKRRHAHERFPSVDAPAPGRVVLVSDEPPLSVTLLLVDAPDPDGGVGGWEELQRDRRTPAIEHGGVPRATLALVCILDRDELQINDLEDRVQKLYAMGREDETTGEPARIKLIGDTPIYNPLWVMDSLKPGKWLKDTAGRLRQIEIVIGLSEWEDATLAVTLPAASTRSTSGKTKARFYTTRAGETLRRVALTQLGSQAQWKTLLADNRAALKSVDPDALLQPGIRLRLTAATKTSRAGR